jgi:hypothetical protein
MASKQEVKKFVDSQDSLHFYMKMRSTLSDILLRMPTDDFRKVTKNLYVLSLQEGIIGQGMVFPDPKGEFKIVSIVYVPKIPVDVLRFIIAHELGHIHRGRHTLNKGDDEFALEKYANSMAKKWGFPPKKKYWKWIFKYMKDFGIHWPYQEWPKE